MIEQCEGPLIWFSVGEPEDAAILECPCGYIIVTGNFHDQRHTHLEIVRSYE